jgi:hypothetical protein
VKEKIKKEEMMKKKKKKKQKGKGWEALYT